MQDLKGNKTDATMMENLGPDPRGVRGQKGFVVWLCS